MRVVACTVVVDVFVGEMVDGRLKALSDHANSNTRQQNNVTCAPSAKRA